MASGSMPPRTTQHPPLSPPPPATTRNSPLTDVVSRQCVRRGPLRLGGPGAGSDEYGLCAALARNHVPRMVCRPSFVPRPHPVPAPAPARTLAATAVTVNYFHAPFLTNTGTVATGTLFFLSRGSTTCRWTTTSIGCTTPPRGLPATRRFHSSVGCFPTCAPTPTRF